MVFYNHMISEAGSKVIMNGWKRSEIYDAIKDGSPALPSIDPFNDIALMVDGNATDVDVMTNQNVRNGKIKIR